MRNKSTIRKIVSSGILFMTIGLLAGCNMEKTWNSQVVTKEDDQIVLTVLAGQSTSDAGIEDMIDELIKEQFPDVTLDWECVDWGEKFDSQIMGRFAAGDIPDIMIGKAQDVYVYAGSGNLAELNVKGMEKINPSALEAVTVNEKIYAMPYNAMYQGVLYNKGIFSELGLEIPKTMDDMRKVVDALNEAGVTPFAAHFQESWNVGNMTMQLFMNSVFNENPYWGDMFRQNMDSYTKNKTIKACMKQLPYILKNSWEDALIIDQYEADKRFSEEKAAMYLTGSWSLQSVYQSGEYDNYGIFPYPNDTGDAKLIRETNMSFMKSSMTEHSELIDLIFEAILQDKALMTEILDFTQTYSVVDGMDKSTQNIIDVDIANYEAENAITDVTKGNNQLVWSFQNDLAVEELNWLQGNCSLSKVLAFADRYRMESGN